jgi:hypothetical protein
MECKLASVHMLKRQAEMSCCLRTHGAGGVAPAVECGRAGDPVGGRRGEEARRGGEGRQVQQGSAARHFSKWLLQVPLTGEIDRREGVKRGGGKQPERRCLNSKCGD